MPLTSYFPRKDVFDYLAGDVPWHLPVALGEMTARTRQILKGRSREEFDSAAQAIDCLVEEYFQSARESFIDGVLKAGSWELGYLPQDRRDADGLSDLLDYWPSDAEDGRPNYPEPENTNDFEALRECIDASRLNKLAGGLDWIDPEYFAVLSLCKVGDVINALTRKSEKLREADQAIEALIRGVTGSQMWPKNIVDQMALNSLLEASEALCWAERLRDFVGLQRTVERLEAQRSSDEDHAQEIARRAASAHISKVATKAAHARHRENREMKATIWSWCDENLDKFESMDAAARHLDVEERLVPVTPRTLRAWITQWRRKQQSARTP